MSNDISTTIAHAAVKLRLRAVCDDDAVSDELFLEVAKQYYNQYGYLPVSWVAHIESFISQGAE